MMHYTAAGSPSTVASYLAGFVAAAGVDELMTVHPAIDLDDRLHSIEMLAELTVAERAAAQATG